MSQLMRARGHQTVGTMPNVSALGSDGKRLPEISGPFAWFMILTASFKASSARERFKKGIAVSEELKKRMEEPKTPPLLPRTLKGAPPQIRHAPPSSVVYRNTDPQHSRRRSRVFDELFPAE